VGKKKNDIICWNDGGDTMKSILRYIPAVHELQKSEQFKEILTTTNLSEDRLTEALKEAINDVRSHILTEQLTVSSAEALTEEIFNQLNNLLTNKYDYTLKRVINATGTILHTNLGRARLSDNATNHMIEVAKNYSNLEYRIEEGERGSRHDHVASLITQLTGAEDAMVVNNNAAAVYFILNALAKNKEVVVSRGQLVEIGGSFRISSIMEESGAILKEVGTTNKTHLFDYENATNEETAMYLKVHTSNFKIIGFTKEVQTEELVSLAEQNNCLVYEDLGRGAILDFSEFKIGSEHTVKQVLDSGVHIVSFSGDKLLGGPQAGIIAGKKELIAKLKKHQLARVLRVDKMTLAALEGTLMDYLKGLEAAKNIPVVRDLLMPLDELKSRSEKFIQQLNERTDGYVVQLMESKGQVGGGTMPEVELDSYAIALQSKTCNAEQLAYSLRVNNIGSVVTRTQKEKVLIDLRTVSAEEEAMILNILTQNKA